MSDTFQPLKITPGYPSCSVAQVFLISLRSFNQHCVIKFFINFQSAFCDFATQREAFEINILNQRRLIRTLSLLQTKIMETFPKLPENYLKDRK